MYTFQLRAGFPKAHMSALAARCRSNDEALIKIGRRSREAGYYSRDDFLAVCGSATSSQLCWTNPPERIKRHTAVAIATASERNRIHSLMHLSGVSWSTASAFLHFTFEGRYPTLSRATLWSWGHDEIAGVGFEFWWAYVEACRALARECRVTMRDLDRALRQFATERKGSLLQLERTDPQRIGITLQQ